MVAGREKNKMFIKIKMDDVILNTDKIEIVRKIINLDDESFPYAVKCNERIIFRAKTEGERDDFFDSLWNLLHLTDK